MKKTANCLNVIRSQKRCSSGEMMWPTASGEEPMKASVLHAGQLSISSGFSKPQLAHFFITSQQANDHELNRGGGMCNKIRCHLARLSWRLSYANTQAFTRDAGSRMMICQWSFHSSFWCISRVLASAICLFRSSIGANGLKKSICFELDRSHAIQSHQRN